VGSTLKIKIVVLLASLLFSATRSHAETETQYWNSVQVSSHINEKTKLHAEWNHRYSEDKSEFVTRAIRAGLSYKFLPELTYTFLLESRKTDKTNNDEIRFIHQISRNYKFSDYDLYIRGRIEQREFTDSSKILHRARILAQSDMRAFKIGNWTPFVYGEYFHILNTVTSRPEGSYETRAFVGIHQKIFSGKLELGYMRRHVNTASVAGQSAKSNYYDVGILNMKWSFE